MYWTIPGPGWLFCPADRPERFAKAAAAADVVILDLEDGVGSVDKAAAREALIATPLNPERTVVRVNPHGTAEHPLDMQALDRTAYRRVMLPKTEAAEQVHALSPREVIVLIESPLGAITLSESVAVSNAIGVMWGAEDLIAALGGKSSRFPNGTYRDVARALRSQTLLTGKAHGRFVLDSVFLDIKDIAGLQEEAADAVAVGFDAKVAIHPTQVDPIRRAYAPTTEEVEWAQRLLDLVISERGVFTIDGRMVDAPVIRQAEQILRHREAVPRPSGRSGVPVREREAEQ